MKNIWKGFGRDRSGRLQKCKPYILLLCVLFAAVMLLGSTLAWFTAADKKTNNLYTPPENGFLVTEVDVFSQTFKDGYYSKHVGAVNLDEKPAFVRLLVMATIVIEPADPGDPPVLLPATIGGPSSGAMIILDDLNTTDWIDGGDGYFYYAHILNGKTTTDTTGPAGYTCLDNNLFNTVRLGTFPGTGYDDIHLQIEVKCEAVGIKPAGEYIEAWWEGVTPASGDLLFTVYEALQAALGLI